MKKQRKLLTTEEKEKICNDRGGVCAKNKKGDFCPLYFQIGRHPFCYKEHVNILEEIIEEAHNEEVEYAGDNEV